MKIVFLDRKTIGQDLNLDKYNKFGEVVFYDFSTEEEARIRTRDADIIVLNKVPINERSIGEADKLKLVCVTATGTNNLDKDYLASRGIEWRNVADYSTDSVAQHTFAMLLYLYEHLPYYDEYVSGGNYVNDKCFTHFDRKFNEIKGKTWGIIGLGNIGRKVAEIATAFGARVVYYSASGHKQDVAYDMVSFDELLATSDIVSIHAPLTDKTMHLMDREAFGKMKPEAVLLNAGRGPIIVEEDLVEALSNGRIAAAGLDVLDVEPMQADCPYRKLADSDKLFITPHIAWASIEARTNLMDIIYGQIEAFIQGC